MFIAFACEAICPELLFFVQFRSHVRLFETPWTAAHQASLSFTISQRLLKLMSIELMMPSNHLILSHLPLFLPSMFPSIRVLSNESAVCIRGQNIGASASVLPMNNQGCFLLGLTGLFSLLLKGLRVFSCTTVQKHQFCGTQPSLWFNSHIHTWLLQRP